MVRNYLIHELYLQESAVKSSNLNGQKLFSVAAVLTVVLASRHIAGLYKCA